MLIDAINRIYHNVAWKAWHFLNPNQDPERVRKETYGFPTTKNAPNMDSIAPELKEFREELFFLAKNIEYRDKMQPSQFQKQLREDVSKIRNDDKMIIPADKTANYYKMKTQDYYSLIEKSIHKEYKKSDEGTFEAISQGDKVIAEKLDIADRVFKTTKQPAFGTVKDHKPNFDSNPSARLINPTKSQIGKVSKQILEKIVENVQNVTKLNQFRKTTDALKFFNSIKDKERSTFVLADIERFYPSISERLLLDALDWAGQYTEITSEQREIIFQANRPILYHKGKIWVKKGDTLFDVTMGSYGGAEVCEIVGLFILFRLDQLNKEKYGGRLELGLYRDDLLGATCLRDRQQKQLMADIKAVFSQLGLDITIQTGLKTVNYLDVTLNMQDGSYKPFNKENHTPVYVHVDSSHPPAILKNIPLSVNKRLTTISSDESHFDSSKAIFQTALNNAGYKHILKFDKEQKSAEAGEEKTKRRRRRKLLFFHPPFSLGVKTNVGKKFFQIVDQVFKKSALGCIFNRKSMRVSYCTTTNVARVIGGHNSKLTAASAEAEAERPAVPARTCNCTKANRDNCPLGGECLVSSVIYSAKVTGAQPPPNQVNTMSDPTPQLNPADGDGGRDGGGAEGGAEYGVGVSAQGGAGAGDGSSSQAPPGQAPGNNNEPDSEAQYQEILYGTYTGQTANSFKERYNSHRSDFRHEKFRTSTRLSELVWSLKDKDKEYDISWSVLAKAKPYSPVTRRCKLCTAEKWWIMERPGTASINRKSELFSACRHMDSQLLTPQRKSKKVGQG